MFRTIVIAALLATSAPAISRVGPPIAYSTATEIYLVNPDGTGKVRLYRSRSNDFISSVALKPGGGTIAFVENWALKFLDYNASGQAVGSVRTIRPACTRLADVDYHPSGNSVIYQELCSPYREVKRVDVPTSTDPNPTPQTILAKEYLVDLGGLDGAGSSFVYTTSTPTQWELWRHQIGGSDLLLATRPAQQIRYPEISEDGLRVLFSNSPLASSISPGPGLTSEVDATSGAALRTNFIAGRAADYGDGDQRVIFISYVSYNERYLRYLDEQNNVKQIGGKGVYFSVDWRN